MWSIAKRYYTTVKRLREINGIEKLFFRIISLVYRIY
ncbi:MAG: LysM peptidoglycan-binding domain-containing protein [Prevotella sp.]|nr:LysM peptidoglycan-binding domain-containing protein [Prevotella sp.]